MDKILKLAVVVGVLLAGGGVFYHYVFFLPAIERQKAEQARQEALRIENAKREAEIEANLKQQSYEICKTGARKNYEANWAAACKSVAELRVSQLRDCLTDRMIITNPYMGKSYCHKMYAARDPSPDCTLPKERADSINKTYSEGQDKCLAEAKLNLQ